MLGNMKPTWAGAICFFVCVATASPQQKSTDPPTATTTVSGHVFCADTNAPARMATVILQPADAIDAITPGESGNIPSSGETAQTSMDGSFTLQHVAPGTYYVIASQVGYISPLALRYMEPDDDPAAKDLKAKKTPPMAPRITVEGNLPVGVNVTIERGAAVSGTVLYDDGSPASGIHGEPARPREGPSGLRLSSPARSAATTSPRKPTMKDTIVSAACPPGNTCSRRSYACPKGPTR